jgi:hypothetical protein
MTDASHGNGDDSNDDDDLETTFANLEAGTIEALEINVLRQTIAFHVQTRWGAEPETHVVIFEDVASFYVILGPDVKRFEWLRTGLVKVRQVIGEWTSAGYYPESVGTVQIHAKPGSWESGWAVRYNTHPNFAVEMRDAMMLIEARLVRIDDRPFEVGLIENDSPDSPDET